MSEQDNNITSANGVARRKFLKGAAAVTPVLLSVNSAPVWARNCTLSGQLSGNLSNHDDEICGGEGCSPGYWGHRGYQIGSWHLQFPPEMMFSDAFGRDCFPNKTLLDVVRKLVEDNEMVVNPSCSDPLMLSDPSMSSHDGSKKADKDEEHSCHNMLRQLGFHAVAALQNAATQVKYDITVDTVISSFQAAYDSGSIDAMERTKDTLDQLNNQYCPL